MATNNIAITNAIVEIIRDKIDNQLIKKTKIMLDYGVTYYELSNLMRFGAKRRTSKRGRKTGYRKPAEPIPED